MKFKIPMGGKLNSDICERVISAIVDNPQYLETFKDFCKKNVRYSFDYAIADIEEMIDIKEDIPNVISSQEILLNRVDALYQESIIFFANATKHLFRNQERKLIRFIIGLLEATNQFIKEDKIDFISEWIDSFVSWSPEKYYALIQDFDSKTKESLLKLEETIKANSYPDDEIISKFKEIVVTLPDDVIDRLATSLKCDYLEHT